MNTLLTLFTTFARIGGLTFGGGYAMLPILQREVVEKYNWVSEEELMDYYAIGQCTPGIIAINTATFIGYKLKGIAGAILATLGCITPSLIIITILSMFLNAFSEIALIASALTGIRICVVVLVLQAVIKLGKKSLKDNFSYILFILVLLSSLFTPISSSILVLSIGVLGFIVALVTNAIKKGGK